MTATLHLFPWVFSVPSSRKGSYLVNLSGNGFKGSCECTWNRVTKTDCRHLKLARELFWKEVAPRMNHEEEIELI